MDKVETMVFVNEGNGNEAITLRDREISDYSVSVGAHTWGWGDTFSTCQIAFTLKSLHPWGMFRKLFVRLFIAVAVALLSFSSHLLGLILVSACSSGAFLPPSRTNTW